MQKCHSMRKDEIDCYILFGWKGHLVEVKGKTGHHRTVNILQQHLLASSVDIFDNQKNKFRFLTGRLPLTDRVTGFPAWQLEFPTGAVTWIFRRYEYNRYGYGMHYAQIEERATFECFITLSLCSTGLGEITQGTSPYSECPLIWRFYSPTFLWSECSTVRGFYSPKVL